MTVKGLLLGTALVAGPIAAMTTPAAAVCDGCVTNAVNNMRVDLRQRQDQTTTAVQNAQQAIVEAITKGVAQTSGYQAQTTESQRRVQEATDVNETIRQRQIARAKAEGGRYDPAASACTDLTGVLQFGGGQAATGAGGNDAVNALRNRSRGNGGEGAEVRAGGLAVAQGIVRDRDEYEGYGGYLDPTSDVRYLTEPATLDTTDEKAAKVMVRLVNNIVDPTPPRPISAAEAKTPQGKAQIAARTIDDARRSAASAVFAYLGDLAAPTGGAALAKWAKGAVTPAYPREVGNVVSTQQAIDIFVYSRFANPDWHQELTKMSPAAVARETALTSALDLHVNWMRFELERRMAAVQAASLAAQLDKGDASTTAIPTRMTSGGGGS